MSGRDRLRSRPNLARPWGDAGQWLANDLLLLGLDSKQAIWGQPSNPILHNRAENKTTDGRKSPSSLGPRCGAINEPGLRRMPSRCSGKPSSAVFRSCHQRRRTQNAKRLMDEKDLKSVLAYSMKYEAAKTVSRSPRHVRPIQIQDDTGRKSDDKFESLCNMLEKLLNSRDGEKKDMPCRNPNVTCWRCNKKGRLQRESAEHEATRITPAEMLFGRTLRLPCDILFGQPSETPSSPKEYMKNLKTRLESIHAFGRE
ncbi:hypothetical protein HNY73_009926 [Argiope bruennichi]|uniref:Uncharacterized protein n=1 Tax=Argiope bruennichi TaxID=94029 RepID=A0A8T0FB69_ARGBR|nr:hypothetical protein HNY73_009926 [Argiope bruennichi]